jgi:hypothetical protein
MDIVCGSCGGENLTGEAIGGRSSAITLTSLDCGWQGSRTPSVACPRCSSADIHAVPIDQSWAYADLEEARDDPSTAEWGYVDKTAFTCSKCHHQWMVAGEYKPYET